MKVIGAAGQFRNGKDEFADHLFKVLKDKSDFDWERTAFANNVKRVFQETFDVDRAFIEEWKVKSECPPGFSMPVRKGLQFIGDGFRQIQPTIWLDLVFRNRTRPAVISDARYINELRAIKRHDGLNFLIWRPGFENDDPNPSEAQIAVLVKFFSSIGIEGPIRGSEWEDRLKDAPEGADLVDFFVINNGTLEDFYRKVESEVASFILAEMGDGK